jgi:hypothetical protein
MSPSDRYNEAVNATLTNPTDRDEPVALAHDDVEPPFDDFFDGDDDDGGDGDGEPIRWVTVASFWNAEQAHLARLQVETDDIPCVLDNEHLVSMNWLWANAVGGVRLRVPEEDAARARRVLRLPQLGTSDERAVASAVARRLHAAFRSMRRAATRAVELLFLRRSPHRRG